MDKSRPVSDRVRPMLQAMERSIDAARRKRLLANDEPVEETVVVEEPAEREIRPLSEHPPRLKARPKRATAFPPRQAG